MPACLGCQITPNKQVKVQWIHKRTFCLFIYFEWATVNGRKLSLLTFYWHTLQLINSVQIQDPRKLNSTLNKYCKDLELTRKWEENVVRLQVVQHTWHPQKVDTLEILRQFLSVRRGRRLDAYDFLSCKKKILKSQRDAICKRHLA